MRAAGGEDPVLVKVLTKYALKVGDEDAKHAPVGVERVESEPEPEPSTGSAPNLVFSSVLTYCILALYTLRRYNV